jgi:hypothetical protein
VRALVAIFTVAVFSSAAAAPTPDGIVVESYAGQRPEDANRFLAPVLDELAKRGYVAGPEVVGRRYEQRVSRANLNGGLPGSFGDDAEKGHKAWIAGRFEEAVKILTPLVDVALANPGAFIQNDPQRDKLLKAMIALALSQQRQGEKNLAKQTFAEILRTYPDMQLSRAQYGPDAFNMFEEVKKELGSAGRGKLVVKPAQEGGVVFINEKFQAIGTVVKADLLPGDYRVLVQSGKTMSRVYRVSVAAGKEAEVTVDADLDAVLHTSPKWTGFQFADAASREKLEAGYAAVVANGISAPSVVVIGIDVVRGKRAIVGSLVLMNGREIRRGSINLDPDPSVDLLRTLARFVAGDNAAPGVDIVLAGDPASAPATGDRVTIGDVKKGADRGDSGMWGGWKYVTTGGAVVALGVGAYLLSVHDDCTDDPCTEQRDTAVPGWISIGAGAALAGVSIYLFIRGDGESSSKHAYVVPTSGGAVAGYSLSW